MLDDALAAMPQRELVQGLLERLRDIPGVEAVVLGGSYAEGTATAQSDVDLGIYYHPAAPFSIQAIRAAAESVAVEPLTVTEFYGWGAWVNGGAWIKTAAGKIDFLYRNLDQVSHTIHEAEQGITHQDYAQQPTYGFYSVMYLAETQICRPLYDPAGLIAGFKECVAVYPPALKRKTVADGLWSAEFTLLHAVSHAAKGDVYNTAGCLGRVAASLTQVLFALNTTYFLSDKRALRKLDGFPIKPTDYVARLTAILGNPGHTPDALQQSTQAITQLWREVCVLAGDLYPPRG